MTTCASASVINEVKCVQNKNVFLCITPSGIYIYNTARWQKWVKLRDFQCIFPSKQITFGKKSGKVPY